MLVVWTTGNDSPTSLPKSFPCLENSPSSLKTQLKYASSEKALRGPIFWPTRDSSLRPWRDRVPVDNPCSHKGMRQDVCFSAPSFPIHQTSCLGIILVSCGALWGPKAPDCPLPGAVDLRRLSSTDASHLPGILPKPRPCLVPIKGKEFMLTEPAVGQALGWVLHTL